MATIEKRTLDDGTTSHRVKVRLKGYPVQTATFERITNGRKLPRRLFVKGGISKPANPASIRWAMP